MPCMTAVEKRKFGKKSQPTFSGALSDFRKATISFIMSVRPSLPHCPHGTTELPLDGFFKMKFGIWGFLGNL